jgi:transcriptional regulator with XRE-family HTH domain
MYSFNKQNIFFKIIFNTLKLLALYMHIGKAIKNLRNLADISQQDLANEIGKTKGLICQIEKTGKVNYYTLAKIASILKSTPEKIEQYKQSLEKSNPINNNLTSQNNLPELDYLRLENLHLKEQINLLKKNIILLESKL